MNSLEIQTPSEDQLSAGGLGLPWPACAWRRQRNTELPVLSREKLMSHSALSTFTEAHKGQLLVLAAHT